MKPGDILRVTFKNGDPFSGVCLSIRLRGVDTAFLLRNELTRVGVEMWVKVFSPDVQSVEIVQRSEKRKRRARLYYMRYVLVFGEDQFGLGRSLLIALLQTTQTRYEKRGEHRVQLSQEEVGSYGSETAETIIVVEYGFGMGFEFCDCIIPHVSSLMFYEYTRMISVHESPKNLKPFYHETQSITAHRQDNKYRQPY